VISPGSYLSLEASIQAVDMESILENSSQESTMSVNNDDEAISKELQWHNTLCLVRWYMYHLMSKVEENLRKKASYIYVYFHYLTLFYETRKIKI